MAMRAKVRSWAEIKSLRSQFFQSLRNLSSQPKRRSTTQRRGSTTNLCNSLRFTTSTCAPQISLTWLAKRSPEYPPSTRNLNLSRVSWKRFILEVKNGIININFRVYTGVIPWEQEILLWQSGLHIYHFRRAFWYFRAERQKDKAPYWQDYRHIIEYQFCCSVKDIKGRDCRGREKHHLQYLKKKEIPLPEKHSITKVCIDDFAFRKRQTYGTIMVDIDTHRVVDLLFEFSYFFNLA